MYQLDNVFGVTNNDVESYIERKQVDSELKKALKSSRHIIVYGASKQGKSSLISRHLKPSLYTKIAPGIDMQVQDIYASIIRQENIPIKETREYGMSRKLTKQLFASLKIKTPIVDLESGITDGLVKEEHEDYTLSQVDYNMRHAQDVCEVLKKINYKKSIVIENFHYLKEQIQKTIATDLRIFNDHGIRFIILGIWRERNRLGQYNGDLIDRIKEIPVDPWDKSELLRVAIKGAEKLNIEFDNNTLSQIITISYQSVGVFQELCKELCLANDIHETQKEKKTIHNHHTLDEAIKRKIRDYGERHIMAINAFVKSKRKKTGASKSMSYYIAKAVTSIEFKNFESSINRDSLENLVKNISTQGVKFNRSEFIRFLNNLSEFQQSKEIWPPLFDYDQTSQKLRIIDSTFFFYLKHSRDKILQEIDEAIL